MPVSHATRACRMPHILRLPPRHGYNRRSLPSSGAWIPPGSVRGLLLDTRDRLTVAGVALFFLSLLTGFLLAAGPSFIVNPRGVLAGHIEGAMNGMFLILVGLVAERVRLPATAARLCVAALLYSAYANWFFTTLGGIVGSSDAMPIAGA